MNGGVGRNFVRSRSINTPAEFSKLEYDDEIITWGLVKNKDVKSGKGVLTNSDLDDAARDGKTLILVIKRP